MTLPDNIPETLKLLANSVNKQHTDYSETNASLLAKHAWYLYDKGLL